MKEFDGSTQHKGVGFRLKFTAKTKKRAAELLDTSLHTINNYWYCNEPKTPECIANPEAMFACYDYGGELGYIEGFDRKKLYTLDEMKELINKHRGKHASYSEYLKFLQH